jgi:hypothetical protein
VGANGSLLTLDRVRGTPGGSVFCVVPGVRDDPTSPPVLRRLAQEEYAARFDDLFSRLAQRRPPSYDGSSLGIGPRLH